MLKKFILILIIGLSLSAVPISLAENNDTSSSPFDILTSSGFQEKSGVQTYGEPASEGDGISIFNAAMGQLAKFWKQIIGIIAVLMITIAGIRMITTTEEETINTQKTIILWSVIGLVLVLMVDVAVKRIFFGEEGQFVFDSPEATITAANRARAEIEGFISWMMTIVGAVSVFMIVLSGLRIILALGKEELIAKEKMMFFWIGFGLVMIALSRVLIYTLYSPETLEGGQVIVRTGNVSNAINQIAGVIQFILVLLGVLTTPVLIYGGFLMLSQWGFEEGMEKAKKIIMNSVIGLIIIFSSYAIIATMVSSKA